MSGMSREGQGRAAATRVVAIIHEHYIWRGVHEPELTHGEALVSLELDLDLTHKSLTPLRLCTRTAPAPDSCTATP